MTEREEIEVLEAQLAKLRAVGERIKKHCLKDDDWPVVAALLSDVIERAAEAGQEAVVIEFLENVPGNAANGADTSEDEADGGVHGGTRPLDPRG
jgi:hypothetical protein